LILGEDETEIDRREFYAILFGVMIFFFFTAGMQEKYKPKCGHQTSYAILIGIVISLLLYWAFRDERAGIYAFNENIFFDLLLPPIILNSGFNMRRKKFFQNIGNITIFGLGVTFTCFTLFSIVTYASL